MLDLSDEPVSMFADPEFVPYESVGSEKYRASRSILAFDGQVGHPVSGVVLSYKDTRLGDNFLAVRTGSKGSSDGAEDAASILAGAVLHMDYYPLGDQYAADECIDLEKSIHAATDDASRWNIKSSRLEDVLPHGPVAEFDWEDHFVCMLSIDEHPVMITGKSSFPLDVYRLRPIKSWSSYGSPTTLPWRSK